MCIVRMAHQLFCAGPEPGSEGAAGQLPEQHPANDPNQEHINLTLPKEPVNGELSRLDAFIRQGISILVWNPQRQNSSYMLGHHLEDRFCWLCKAQQHPFEI